MGPNALYQHGGPPPPSLKEGSIYKSLCCKPPSLRTDVTAAPNRNPAGCHSVTLPKLPSPLRKERTLNLHAQTSPASRERSKMDFTLRAANVDDCKDISRMILVRLCGRARHVCGRLCCPSPAAFVERETQTGSHSRGTSVGRIKMSVLCTFIVKKAALY